MSTEDDLCRLFAEAVRDSASFRRWLLSRTGFRDRTDAHLLHKEQRAKRPKVKPENWWRHWWCKIPETGEERETDVFLVFEDTNNIRFALHVENKKGAAFLAGQAKAYRPRATHMMGKERYLNYTEFETVLICPSAYLALNQGHSEFFDRVILYEDIAGNIAAFDTGAMAMHTMAS